eukprot:2314337-Lingulodinium_polyedra.AAC.1
MKFPLKHGHKEANTLCNFWVRKLQYLWDAQESGALEDPATKQAVLDMYEEPAEITLMEATATPAVKALIQKVRKDTTNAEDGSVQVRLGTKSPEEPFESGMRAMCL